MQLGEGEVQVQLRERGGEDWWHLWRGVGAWTAGVNCGTWLLVALSEWGGGTCWEGRLVAFVKRGGVAGGICGVGRW